MDRELAKAVFDRWNTGQAVSEESFYKAAEVSGVHPGDALLEARFYTMLDADLAKLASGGDIDEGSALLYVAAAGIPSADVLVKTAQAYRINPLELALEKLAERGWVPDLGMVKAAIMAPPMGGEDSGSGLMGGAQAAQMAAQPPQAGGPTAGGPMGPAPGAAVQQAPQNRYKPSPMAPSQVPPSSEGNLSELVEAARHPDSGQEMGMGGMGPEQGQAMGGGAGPEPPPPMPPEDKIMQVAPDTPQERLPEYAAKLQELEQNVGMPVNDPAQVTKLVAQLKKEDAKKVDEAIKQMGTPEPLTTSGSQPQGGGQQPAKPQPAKPAPAAQGQTPQPQSGGAEKVAFRRAMLP